MKDNTNQDLSAPLLGQAAGEPQTSTTTPPAPSASVLRQPSRLRLSGIKKPPKLLKSSILADYNEVRGDALPITRAANHDSFMHYFSCGDPDHDPQSRTKAKVSLWRLLSYSTWNERCLMIFGILNATVSGLGIPTWLVLLASSLDTFSNLGALISKVGGEGLMNYLQQELLRLCIAFAIVGVICLATGTLYVSIWTYTGEKQALRIQTQFVRASMNQDAAWFDNNDREALPTKMGTALVHINNAIGKQVVDVYANAISAIGCMAVSLMLNTQLSLVMLCVVPVVLIIMALFNMCIRRVKKRAGKEIAEAGGIATEALAGIKTVASLCAQPYFRTQYETHVNQSAKSSIMVSFLSSLLAGITGMLFYMTYTFAFYIGTEQVVSGADMKLFITCFISGEPQCRVTGASVMCCIYGVILCVTFFGLMGPGLAAINLGRSAGVEVFNTLGRTPTIDPSSVKGKRIEEDKGLQGKITFKDLFFFYPNSPNRPIFYNFNLTIEPGQSVALVGPSGSGKSTIARFLLRFYDPNQGEILIDDKHPLTALNVSWWRSQIGYVAQEPVIFPGTIRENIALGKPSSDGTTATEEEVINAAKMACAHDFILNLPDGYDTYYGGTSVQLSGGQMQRIAIARALIRDPKILVLDEATSALDQMSEEHVQNALANIRKEKRVTTVTIAHRLTTIMDSDAIAVIANGKISELGNHETLIQKEGGIYRLLCESQGITPSDPRSSVVPEEEGVEVPTPVTGVSRSSDEEAAEEGLTAPSTAPEEEEEEVDMDVVATASMSSIWRHVGWDSLYTLMGVIGSGIVGALSPCESILTAQIVATFYIVDADEMVETNRPYIAKFLYFALASLIGNTMVGFGLSRSGSNLGAKLRNLSFSAMMKRSMGWFDLPDNTTGELTTILGADIEAVEGLTGLPLGHRVRVLTSLVTGVVIALVYSLEIGLVAIACVPLIMIAGAIQVCCQRKKVVAHTDGPSPPTIMEQGLRGIASVQAYNLEKKVGDDYERAVEPESAGKVKSGIIAGTVFGFSQFAVFVSFAVVFYVGSDLMVKQKIGFVEFFTSVLAVMFGALGASQVSADFNSRQRGLASAARIFSTLDGPTDGSEKEVGEVVPIKGDIVFKSCEFSYPARPDFPIFYKSPERDGVNLSVAQKESIGLVGRSGSGKSTILQIVMRFYEITGGSAALDGHEFSELNVTNLRQQVGYVGQLPTLFNGTVRSNILLGKPDASENEIISACRAAQAHDFIMNLSDGYDTHVGPGGGLLSGGQKQRIAIARAIIRDPKILVLDEATAALDNESQKLVQATLDELQQTQPRTTLTVAHRLLTIKDCDKIAFLGDGGVLEIGTHSDLLEMKGNYYELWCMQGSEEELEQLKTS
mmetsp:Transcript_15434/g.32636  ORF Transcript_15434/g.32636 Transcript_15434/m.32636 type:complete len:1373 (-) Transcript_15434:205-4323(-)